MARTNIQKIKLLYLMKIMLEETDEKHMLNTKDIIEKLSEYGIEAERKSIYSDLEALRSFGFNIVTTKSKVGGCYIKNTLMDNSTLKIIIDVIRCSDIISQEKAEELVQELIAFATKSGKQQIERPYLIIERPETMLDSIYARIERIHTAIVNNVKVNLKYFSWTISEDMKIKKKITEVKISPVVLFKYEGEYYLIYIDEVYGISRYVKLKKIVGIDFLQENRSQIPSYGEDDKYGVLRRKREITGGIEYKISVLFDNKFLDLIIDKLGKTGTIQKETVNSFSVTWNALISKEFFGWLTGLGTGVKILYPAEVIDMYQTYLMDLLEQYK